MRVRTVRMMTLLILGAGSSTLALAQTKTPVKDAPLAGLAAPETPGREVKEIFFGTEISDPYRWLEDLKSPEVSSWMHAQNDYTRAVLERVPSRDKLRARIAELDDSGVRVNGLQSFGGRLFYLKQATGEDNRRLYVRDGTGGAERLVLDPQTRTTNGVHYSIDYFQASPDGKLVAVGVLPGGSENSVLPGLDASDGKEAAPSIDGGQFG